MIYPYVPFGQDLFQVPIRNGVADIEEDGEEDYFLRKLSALERNRSLQSNKVDPNNYRRPFRPGASTSKVCDRTMERSAAQQCFPAPAFKVTLPMVKEYAKHRGSLAYSLTMGGQNRTAHHSLNCVTFCVRNPYRTSFSQARSGNIPGHLPLNPRRGSAPLGMRVHVASVVHPEDAS